MKQSEYGTKRKNRTGILYGIGVGPGDPELITLKAVRLIRETEVIALPGKCAKETAAYRIAVQAVPELADKTLLSADFPMTRDPEQLEKSHEKSAKQLEEILKTGRNAAFLTLGDVSIYSTFSYVQRIVEEDGYEVRLVSGVPSFCAAAASLGISLAERNEILHVIPATYTCREDDVLTEPGNYVLMKSGKRLAEVKEQLRKSGFENRNVSMAENCGMPDQKLYRGLENIPDQAGYFSLMIAKGDRK